MMTIPAEPLRVRLEEGDPVTILDSFPVGEVVEQPHPDPIQLMGGVYHAHNSIV